MMDGRARPLGCLDVWGGWFTGSPALRWVGRTGPELCSRPRPPRHLAAAAVADPQPTPPPWPGSATCLRLALQVRDSVFGKGQSRRIWGELYKVLDSSDVVIEVRQREDRGCRDTRDDMCLKCGGLIIVHHSPALCCSPLFAFTAVIGASIVHHIIGGLGSMETSPGFAVERPLLVSTYVGVQSCGNTID